MASLISPVTPAPQQNPKIICFSTFKPNFHNDISSFTKRLKGNSGRCKAFFGNIPDDLLENTLQLDQFSVFQSGLVQFQSVTEELSDTQKWGLLVFAGVAWIYLTARPGILIGAIDAYLLAPLQLGLDSLSGRRNLKRSDFLVGDKLGEGSFGVVYSGVVVPRNATVDEKVPKRGTGRALQLSTRFKEKVILKKVTSFFPCIIEHEYTTAFPSLSLIYILERFKEFQFLKSKLQSKDEFLFLYLVFSMYIVSQLSEMCGCDGDINGNVQVKVGVTGAEQFGEYEEWFNYRLSRAAPETCAKFLGSFVAESDRTSSQFTKGGKWLVWKFEVFQPAGNLPRTFETLDKKSFLFNFLMCC